MSSLISAANTLYTIATNPLDSLMGLIGSIIISITSLVLYLAQTVFELVLNATVIGFGATLKQYGILDGIETVWSAFRDISNIVIIGMFVFVAISMILGNTTYGAKKFVVRILTVAILINFSLLFTQLVVDVSNLAANQFYKGVRAAAMNSQSVFQETNPGAVDQATNTLWDQQGGVAGAFMNKMGISSFFDTAGMVAAVADSQTSYLKSIGLAMFFTFVVVALIIATAAVFLYGAYLMLARGLLLIFLLATSSLAFAAWLVPKYGEGKYGWDGWLTTLIQSAVFAPMLMIMLWASLVILSKAPTGSLGAFIQHPDATSPQDAMATVIVYLFTLGMLYLSLKVSSSFSKKITGFNIAMAVMNATGRWTGGAVGTLGRMGVRGIERTSIPGKAKDGRLWSSPTSGPAGNIEKALAKLTKGALSTAHNASLNPARIPQAFSEKLDNLDKRYGFSTQGKGGVAAADERSQKALEEKMRRDAAVSDVDKKNMFKEVKEAIREESKTGNQKFAEQTQAIRKQVAEKEDLGKQLAAAFEKEAHSFKGTPEMDRAVAARKELERKVNESSENIKTATEEARKAAEAMLDTKENKDLIADAKAGGFDTTKIKLLTEKDAEVVAIERTKAKLGEKINKRQNEIIEKKFPGEDNAYKRNEILKLAEGRKELSQLMKAWKQAQKESGGSEDKSKPKEPKEEGGGEQH